MCTHPEHLPGNAKIWIFKYSAYFLTFIDVHDKRDIKGIKRAKNISNGLEKISNLKIFIFLIDKYNAEFETIKLHFFCSILYILKYPNISFIS